MKYSLLVTAFGVEATLKKLQPFEQGTDRMLNRDADNGLDVVGGGLARAVRPVATDVTLDAWRWRCGHVRRRDRAPRGDGLTEWGVRHDR